MQVPYAREIDKQVPTTMSSTARAKHAREICDKYRVVATRRGNVVLEIVKYWTTTDLGAKPIQESPYIDNQVRNSL